MFNSTVFEVVIGLIFIYLLYSLFTTTIMEIIATRFSFRGKILERAIFRMLEDDGKSQPRVKSVIDLFKKKVLKGEAKTATDGFYQHPLMKFLGENNSKSHPSYISKDIFSKVIIDLLRGKQVKPGDDVKQLIQEALNNKNINWANEPIKINDETLSYINSIWADAQGDVTKFKLYLENWFDATMERATGWYKKNTQFILFFIGLTIAVVFNVDTIKIASTLENDPQLREQLIQQADNYVQAHPDLDKQYYLQKVQLDSIKAQLAKNNHPPKVKDSLLQKKIEDSLTFANTQALKAVTDTLMSRANSLVNNDIEKSNSVLGIGWNTYDKYTFTGFLLAILGWVITAIALSMGAPFWFDLLNKMMKLRSSVPKTVANDKPEKQEK
jgi:hypothetical protein